MFVEWTRILGVGAGLCLVRIATMSAAKNAGVVHVFADRLSPLLALLFWYWVGCPSK